MKNITPGMRGYLAQKVVPALATFWVITRKDGAVLAFTDWSETVIAGGLTYQATPGMSRSAIQQRVDLAVPGFEATAFLLAANVTDTDIDAGKYDGAIVQVFMANPLDNVALTGSVVALAPSETVLPGDFEITSPSGNFRLQFQTDGNLVLLQEPGSAVIWASGTAGMGVTGMTMQVYGNLVIDDGVTDFFNSAVSPIVAAEPIPGSRLVLQNDGNLVVYSPGDVATWSSGTGHDGLGFGLDAFPLYSTIPLPGHFIGQITQLDGVYKAEIRGLGYVLQQSFVELFTPLCTADFGDARCKLDLAPFTDTGTVTDIPVTNKVITVHLNSTNALGRYRFGVITFVSGGNEGVSIEVVGWTGADGSDGNLALYLPTNLPIQVGDTFSIVPGCDKSFLANDKALADTIGCYQWSNTDNFRGFPYIPGMIFLLDYGVQTG
jgi:uncharacterized phage protein (TIGR02218 family)